MTLGECEQMFADNCCQKTSKRALVAAVQQAKPKQPWENPKYLDPEMLSVSARSVIHVQWTHRRRYPAQGRT